MADHPDSTSRMPAQARARVRAEVLAYARQTPPGQHRKWPAPAAAAAAVAALTAAAVLAPALDRAPTDPAPASTGAAWQWVSSLGLEVQAPADWPINVADGCSTPPPAEIVRGNRVVMGCGGPLPRERIAIDRGTAPLDRTDPTLSGFYDASPAPTVSPQQVRERDLDGHLARERVYRLDGSITVATLTVPHLGVQLTVTSRDESVVRHALDTARIVDRDTLGCDTVPPVAGWDVPRTGPRVDLAGRGAVTSVTVCGYELLRGEADYAIAPGDTPADFRLTGSTKLTGDAADAAVTAIDDADAGPTPDSPVEECLRGIPETLFLSLQVQYADATTREVRVHYDGCQNRWVATREGLSQATQAQLHALLGPLLGSWGSRALPAR